MKDSIRPLILLFAIAFLFPQPSSGVGNDNPTGVAGAFNGSITTGGSYDPYTGNASRVVEDLAVPGSVGAYPLKWNRVLNTRYINISGRLGAGGWASSYYWSMWVRHATHPLHWNDADPDYEGPDCVVYYPDGRVIEFYGEPGGSYWAMDTADSNARLEYSGHGQDYEPNPLGRGDSYVSGH
jgi:hypothetical protein